MSDFKDDNFNHDTFDEQGFSDELFEQENTRKTSKQPKSKVAQFMKKQGFYVVMFLCISLIGVTTYLALSSNTAEDPQQPNEQVQQIEHGGLEEQLNSSPSPTLAASPSPSPSATQPQTTAPAKTTISLSLPVDGEIVKEFSQEELLYSETLNQWMTHGGIDLAAAEGTEVKAAMAGTVESAESDGLMGYTVVIKHNDDYRTVYSNLAETDTVKAGDVVAEGQVIGTVGKTAISESLEESHLHFELLQGETRENPEQYLETVIKSSGQVSEK